MLGKVVIEKLFSTTFDENNAYDVENAERDGIFRRLDNFRDDTLISSG